MKKYEVMLLYKGTKGEAAAKKTSEQFSEIVQKLGGSVLSTDFWGKKKLAYKIGQEQEGFYEVAQIELSSSNNSKLKSQLNLVDNIVRYLITAKADQTEA